MTIIISPAKKMRIDRSMPPESVPEHIEKARLLRDTLKAMSCEALKKVWACSDTLAAEAERDLREVNPEKTAAVVAYDGIQYLYMAPETFTPPMIRYVQSHLRILSGLYGVLAPLDGIIPYRLEMQAKLRAEGKKDLYDFWGDSLYRSVLPDDRIIINLASNEYSRAIWPYLRPEDRMITCVFGELSGEKVVQKGVYAKMARGLMVRYLAENEAVSPEQMKQFCLSGYRYCPARSNESEYVFLKEAEPETKKPRPAFEWSEC